MRIGLFDLAQRRLAWTEQRQAVLARNVANASTPAFQARDIQSFADAMRDTAAAPARTQPRHLAPREAEGGYAVRPLRARARAPDGNTVALDEQLSRLADTESAQALTSNIFKKYMGLFAMALGKA